MSPSETDAARQRLITKVLGARTLPEIAEATDALDHWLKVHPGETGMADGYEQLSMMQDAAEAQQAQAVGTAKATAKIPAHA